ncbi:hypothetical protein ACGDLY_016735 [Vibrio campbellii]
MWRHKNMKVINSGNEFGIYKKKITKTRCNSKNKTVKKIADELVGIEFEIKISKGNKNQINSGLDSKVEEHFLNSSSWEIASGSKKHKEKLRVYLDNDEDFEVGELDLIIYDSDIGANVFVEIEKTNKLKIWNDFIKLSNKIKFEEKSIGVIICPMNYATRKNNRNLFAYANRYKQFMIKTFGKKIMKKIHIVGYEQQIDIYGNGEFVTYNNNVVKSIKKEYTSRT